MKFLLVLLCAVTCLCDGYPAIDGEISEEVLIKNDTSVEYLFETTNVTYSNDSLVLHGFFKKVGGGIKGGIKSIKTKINNLKGKIGGKTGSGSGIGGGRYIGGIRTRTNSGSGTTNPESIKWVFIGIGIILLVTLGGFTLYYWQTRKRRSHSTCVPQQGKLVMSKNLAEENNPYYAQGSEHQIFINRPEALIYQIKSMRTGNGTGILQFVEKYKLRNNLNTSN